MVAWFWESVEALRMAISAAYVLRVGEAITILTHVAQLHCTELFFSMSF